LKSNHYHTPKHPLKRRKKDFDEPHYDHKDTDFDIYWFILKREFD
jgi:hypothetical protein